MIIQSSKWANFAVNHEDLATEIIEAVFKRLHLLS
jgi:hypothetical protein